MFLISACSYIPQQLFLHWKRRGNLLKPLPIQHLPSKCIWQWHDHFRTQLHEPTKEMWDFSLQVTPGTPWPRGLGNPFFPNRRRGGTGGRLALSQGMPKSFRNLLHVKLGEGRGSLDRSRLADLGWKKVISKKKLPDIAETPWAEVLSHGQTSD